MAAASKNAAYCPPSSFDSADDHEPAIAFLNRNVENVSDNFFKMLGAPLGSPDSIDAFLRRYFEGYPSFLPRLKKMDPHIALTLLRSRIIRLLSIYCVLSHPI